MYQEFKKNEKETEIQAMLRSKEVLSLTGEPRSQFPNVAQRERLENIDLGVTDTTM